MAKLRVLRGVLRAIKLVRAIAVGVFSLGAIVFALSLITLLIDLATYAVTGDKLLSPEMGQRMTSGMFCGMVIFILGFLADT